MLFRKKSSDQTEAIIKRHLDGDFVVYPMAESTVSARQIRSIADQSGVTYPKEFISHLSGRFPGIYIAVRESVWPRPKLHDIGPFWSFLYAMHTYTPTSDSEPWMRLDIAAKEFQSATGKKAAPIIRIVGDADLYCVGPEGNIFRFNHDTSELKPVSLNFWQIFEQEVKALRNRKDMKVSGG